MKAKIIKHISNSYDIIDLKSHEIFKNIKAKGILRYKEVLKDSNFLKQKTFKTKIEDRIIKISPKVGDIVEYEILNNLAVIVDVMTRKNELTRPPLANIDIMFLIMSCKDPNFSFELLDHFLIVLEKSKIETFIIITKIDLLTQTELLCLKDNLKYYENIGYHILYVNNFARKQLSNLEELFKDQTIGIMGQTGVGKSSFLNSINNDLNLKTQEISYALGRGKHTTRHNELYPFLNGLIADTPGFSKIDLDILYKEDLKKYYPDFLLLEQDCKLKGKCLHIQEPGCKVIEDYKKGDILKTRYENYKNTFFKIKNIKRKY